MRKFPNNALLPAVLLIAAGLAGSPDSASAQTWSNWTAANVAAGNMSGTLGSTTISYAGGFDGYQLSNGTTRSASVTASPNPCGFAFFCKTAPYTSAGVNAPTNNGFIQYTNRHSGTITFGTTVTNPLIAFISVGAPWAPVHYTFSSGFTVLSDNSVNAAAWGAGLESVIGNTVLGTEFSGVIRLNGTFDSFSYTVDDAENWSGLTVGVQDVGVSTSNVVPEPSTYALMGVGIFALGVAAKRRRRPDAKDKLYK